MVAGIAVGGSVAVIVLGQTEITAVSEALRELYAHTDASSLPHCVVRLLHRLIPADSAAYNSFNFQTGEMVVVHDHGPDGDRYLPALQKHVQEHPLLAHVRAHWQSGAATISDVITHRELRDLGIYSEFLHPLRIERQLGLLVEDQKYGATAVALQRNDRDFSKRDKAVLTFLQPHIIQAFKNASDLRIWKNRVAGVEGAANLCNTGAVWLSKGERIEWMSNRAEFWLREYFPQSAPVSIGRRPQLPAALTSWIQRQKVKQGKTSGAGWRSEQRVAGPRGELNVYWVCEEPNRAYLILSEERRNHEPVELHSLGLTLREAEVLHWITEGKSNEAIGILLRLSKRTVEKHVERILAKMGVESRTEAALRAVACRNGAPGA